MTFILCIMKIRQLDEKLFPEGGTIIGYHKPYTMRKDGQ
jgi:hypothetical protein